MDLETFNVILFESLPFTTAKCKEISWDIFTIHGSISKRLKILSDEFLLDVLKDLNKMNEEPKSWKAEITIIFNRKFSNNANVVSAVLRSHPWFCEGESAFEKMEFLSEPLLAKIAAAPDNVKNKATKLAADFMKWWKSKSEEPENSEEKSEEKQGKRLGRAKDSKPKPDEKESKKDEIENSDKTNLRYFTMIFSFKPYSIHLA